MKIVSAIWQELLDKDDRNSPEEYPDMVLITLEELTDAVARGYSQGIKECIAVLPDTAPDRWDAHHNRSYEPVETLAAELYEPFATDNQGVRWPWVPGGNSTHQDEARVKARRQLRAAGHVPSTVGGRARTQNSQGEA